MDHDEMPDDIEEPTAEQEAARQEFDTAYWTARANEEEAKLRANPPTCEDCGEAPCVYEPSEAGAFLRCCAQCHAEWVEEQAELRRNYHADLLPRWER